MTMPTDDEKKANNSNISGSQRVSNQNIHDGNWFNFLAATTGNTATAASTNPATAANTNTQPMTCLGCIR